MSATLKAISRSLIGSSLVLLTLGHATAQRELTVALTSGPVYSAAKSAFIEPFERETGIRVISQPLDPLDAFVRLKAMHDAGTVTMDVVVVETRHLVVAGREGLLEPIDYSVVDRNAVLPQAADKYGVGVDIWGNALAYNKNKYSGKLTPTTWADFWDLNRFPGPRVLRDDPYPALVYALLADGVSPDSIYPLDVDRAFRKLDQIKSKIIWYKSGGQPPQMLLNGVTDLAMCGISRCVAKISEGAPLGLVWNGGTADVDYLVVAKGTRNREAAMKFIAFVTRADRQAEFAKLSLYAPTNPRAFQSLSPEVAATLPSSPEHYPNLVKSDWNWWVENYDRLTERWNTWKLR